MGLETLRMINDRYVVHDGSGAVWEPDSIMQDAIHHAPEPAVFAAVMCRRFPHRGNWRELKPADLGCSLKNRGTVFE
jgi:hypothetical protein